MRFIFLFIFFSSNLSAIEKLFVEDNLYWLSYTLNLRFDNSTRLYSNFQTRRLIPDSKPNHTVGTMGLIKSFPNKWNISAGFTYFRLHLPQEVGTPVELVPQEFRPYQYISLNNDVVGKLKFTNRIMLEERFFQDIDNGELTNNYNFSLRLRLLGRFYIDFLKINSDVDNFGFYISNEILVHYGHRIIFNTFDQNRFQAGFSYKHNKNLHFNLGYLHWFQETSEFTNEGFFYLWRHTAVFGVTNNFNLFK